MSSKEVLQSLDNFPLNIDPVKPRVDVSAGTGEISRMIRWNLVFIVVQERLDFSK
jgi:hypothetical protein